MRGVRDGDAPRLPAPGLLFIHGHAEAPFHELVRSRQSSDPAAQHSDLTARAPRPPRQRRGNRGGTGSERGCRPAGERGIAQEIAPCCRRHLCDPLERAVRKRAVAASTKSSRSSSGVS